MHRIRIAICLLAVALWLTACQGKDVTGQDPHPNRSHEENSLFATPENPVDSPSGVYTMTVVPGFHDNVFDNHFVIARSDDPERPVFESTERYRTRDRLYFLWDESDNVWVYSGDTGAMVWLREGDSWVEGAPESETMPDDLRAALDKR
mgnify:CR=1 FL=1